MFSAETFLSYPYWKFRSLYTQMPLINSWVLLLVIIVHLLQYSQEE